MPLPFSIRLSANEPEVSAHRAAEALPSGGVLYYALGGGLGHLTRAEAIARQWSRLSAEPFHVLTNCRFTVPAGAAQLRLEEPDPDPAALGRLVRHLLAALRPRLFVADAFPAGILGELPEALPTLPCRRAAILRRLQPQWVERWDLPRLLPDCYHGAALIEDRAQFEGFPTGFPACATPPVLIRDADELLPQPAARAELQPEGAGPILAVSVTGARPADQGLVRLCERLGTEAGAQVRVVNPYPQGSLPGRHLAHFPLIEWLLGVDLVVGPAGYNLFHEARATGTPAIWVPQRRQYDDQFGRAAQGLVAHDPGELERLVRKRLHRVAERRQPAYANGAAAVAHWLLKL